MIYVEFCVVPWMTQWFMLEKWETLMRNGHKLGRTGKWMAQAVRLPCFRGEIGVGGESLPYVHFCGKQTEEE